MRPDARPGTFIHGEWVGRRVDSLDVARGTAMLFVCLSHFAGAYLAPTNSPALSPAMLWSGQIAGFVSMIASPSFIVVSGIVVGYLHRANPSGMPSLRRKLIDRGLFLLLIGHFLVAYPYYVQEHDASNLRFERITDAIAVLIFIGPSLVMWTSARTRVLIGVALLGVSWSVSCLWMPSTPVVLFFTRYAFGFYNDTVVSGFPFIPWLGVWVLATALGERLEAHARSSEVRSMNMALARPGLVAFAVGATITLARHTLRVWAPSFANTHATLFEFLSLSRRYPPGPGYLLVFGGAGLVVIALAFSVAHSNSWRAAARPLSAIGRASFFVFILQGYVYVLALPAMGLPFPELWPAYYAASILVLLVAATLWNSLDANRFLSVGLWRTVPIMRAVSARVRTNLVARRAGLG